MAVLARLAHAELIQPANSLEIGPQRGQAPSGAAAVIGPAENEYAWGLFVSLFATVISASVSFRQIGPAQPTADASCDVEGDE